MTNNELLADWLQDFAHDMHSEVETLSPAELDWQVDREANSIGVTVWHVSRWLDLLAVRVLENRPPEDEQWHTRGWRSKTGYDPRGVGSGGLGAISGYTLEEVAAIPNLTAEELLTYVDQACLALRQSILTVPAGALHQTAPGLGGTRTAYEWIKLILFGCFGHLGEIRALKAIRTRAYQDNSTLQESAVGA